MFATSINQQGEGMNQKERIENAIEALRLSNEWISMHWATGFGDVIERNVASIGALCALTTPQSEASDRDEEAADQILIGVQAELGIEIFEENWAWITDEVIYPALVTLRADERRKAEHDTIDDIIAYCHEARYHEVKSALDEYRERGYKPTSGGDLNV